jgi:hypothetical protein
MIDLNRRLQTIKHAATVLMADYSIAVVALWRSFEHAAYSGRFPPLTTMPAWTPVGGLLSRAFAQAFRSYG